MLIVASALLLCTCRFLAAPSVTETRPSAAFIGPYLQSASPTGVTVCWFTRKETTGVVTCTEAASSGRRRPQRVSDTRPVQYHRVRLSSLRPHARYRYTIACQGQRQIGSFVTAARPGQPFRFAAYGDSRTYPDRHATVIARMARFQPDFALHTGDLVERGRDEDEWRTFFEVATPLLRNAPFYPVPGNHEENGAPYYRYFRVPRDYSFDYGDAHFTLLDSTRPPGEGPAQRDWLRQDLAAHQHARWRIVSLHYPLYTCSLAMWRRRGAEAVRTWLEPLLQEGRVSLVLSGHAHSYQHHLAGGIHYVVTGGGGAPLTRIRPDTPFVVAAKSARHHCEITVRGRKLALRAVQPDAAVIEQFSLQSAR